MTTPVAAQLLHKPSGAAVATTEKREFPKENGADARARTGDLRFTKPLLYQLSYVGKKWTKTTSLQLVVFVQLLPTTSDRGGPTQSLNVLTVSLTWTV